MLIFSEERIPWTLPKNLNAKAQILIWVEGPRRAVGTSIGGWGVAHQRSWVVRPLLFFQNSLNIIFFTLQIYTFKFTLQI